MFSNFLNTEAALSKIFLISERLIIFDGIDDVFNHIVKTAVSLIGAEAATIRIFEVASGKLKIMKGYGVSQEFFSQPAMNIGEGISGRVVLEGKPFLTENLATEPHCINKEIAKLEGIKSFMCVPLKTREMCIGTLSVYRKNKEAFTDYDMVILNIFGMQAAEALEKAKLVAELTKQATFDHLTGMYNKNAILSIIDKNLSLSSRYEMKSCVIFLDIDGFKGFNDTHGHLLGDKLLLDFATILKKMLRKSDSIGRFGGDEFVIIVPQTTKEQALHIVNKMKKNIEEHNFIGKEAAKVKITFSAGIVAYPEGGNSVDELINKSDEALYQSKALGKNRVTLWSPS
jgi:diguanylate cyclase (GGDEF)-like protein